MRQYPTLHFHDLQLIDPLLRAVDAQGYTEPTPIQAQAIPSAIEGRDIVGLAQTGTGKTAAFALPVLQRLAEDIPPKGKYRKIRALVLAPTRELASQISDSFRAYGKHLPLYHAVIFGGVNQNPQVKKLKRGVDVVIATPGRLLDLMGQGHIRLDAVEFFVLDEADRMLDMGFMPDIERIVDQLPTERQTLFFSATMPPDIQKLTRTLLTDPVKVEVAPESTTVESIEQSVYFVEKKDKRNLLMHLLEQNSMHRTLVFTRTKHGANKLSEQLSKARIKSEAIHGNKSQNARQRALDMFKKGKVQVLVATDIAARGIDVEDVSHVVNYDLPNESETYVHRIGRTGRAGNSGEALAFCSVDERDYLRDIERLTQVRMDVVEAHPYLSDKGTPEPTDLTGKKRRGNGGGKKRSRNRKRNHSGKSNYQGKRNRSNRNRQPSAQG